MNQDYKFKYSLCIPTYNCYSYLERALDSVLMQDFQDMEIIIVDNHSDDNCWEKTKILAEKDNRIKIYRNFENIGFVRNWNKCIEYSCGEYVHILHSDDELLKGMIKKACKYLDENSSVGLAHTNGYDCHKNGKMLIRKTQNTPILKAGKEALWKCLSNHNFICSSVVIRRECYGTGFLTDNLSPDAEMYARVARDHDMGHIDEPLVKCNIHEDSTGILSLLENSPEYVEEQWVRLGKCVLSYFPISEQKNAEPLFHNSLANGLWAAGANAWNAGKFKTGQHFFMRAYNYLSVVEWCKRYFRQILRVFKDNILVKVEEKQ